MKRVQSACLEQTVHFMLKEDQIGHQAAVRAVQEEVRQYKAELERKHTRHRILSEQTQADGSVVLKLKKQYNQYDCGDYLK